MSLEETTRREIEQDCTRLINLYAVLNDAADWDGLADLYTPDARFARPSAPDDFICGREAILAAFRARPPRKSRHVIANIVVEVEGPATARAFSVIVLYQGEAAEAGALPKMTANSPLVGFFEDRLVNTPHGWRFAERRGGLDFAP
ncbi:MAG: nuclear transport factor 2 family protein [Sphingomonadales bacterium]|nr:nuclear transport factor 2 family protein [Sphingomonadales bacterium]MBD3772958.1 nuclear transport factor 2 family protein [Paracoccaceae bacterium]